MLPESAEFKILLLSRDISSKNILRGLIEGEGWSVDDAQSSDTIINSLSGTKYDILVLDYDNENTIDLCKKIRSSLGLRYLPILVMADKSQTIERIKAIYAGADDYVEKPVDSGEILTRIKVNLWRASRDLDANPLTKLPGNVTILKELKNRLTTNEIFCVAYADLNKFKEYNDYYGFEWGDRVLRHTADIISDVLKKLGTPGDFLGHIGGDDFIFITGFESIKNICETIIAAFDKTIGSFYKEEDLKRGYIIVKNREGKVTASSVLTISIGISTNKHRTLKHVGEIIQIATELKAYAKTFAKSIYTIDRRT